MIAQFLLLVIIGLFLAMCYYDYTYQRLPNGLTIPSSLAAGAFLSAWEGDADIQVALVWPLLYLVMWLSGKRLGGGDVKLSFSTGAVASIGGIEGVLGAIIVANLLSIFAALRGREFVAHGPHMMIAAVSAFLLA